MTLISLEGLLTKVGAADWLKKGLAVAEALGLPVSSWTAGDPTRSLYHYNAQGLGELEQARTQFAQSGFLDTAQGDWLKLGAKQVYDVDAIESTRATTDVILTNTAGGEFPLEERSVTFRNGTTEKTYTNITGGLLSPGPGTTLTVTVEADEPGSASSALPGEINELVTTLLGVTVTNPLRAVAIDDESKARLVLRCRAQPGALSSNGPRDAYVAVALNPKKTGTTNVTRAQSIRDSDEGKVTLYIASPSGPVTQADRDAVQTAILKWATPQCFKPNVQSANAVIVDIAYQLWVYDSIERTEDDIRAAVHAALERMAEVHPIGGDVIPPAATGRLYRSLIETTILRVVQEFGFRVALTAPATDIDLERHEVAVIGTVTGTVTLVPPP